MTVLFTRYIWKFLYTWHIFLSLLEFSVRTCRRYSQYRIDINFSFISSARGATYARLLSLEISLEISRDGISWRILIVITVRLRKDGLILTYSPCNRPGDDGCNECLTARRLMRFARIVHLCIVWRRYGNNYCNGRDIARKSKAERYFIIARIFNLINVNGRLPLSRCNNRSDAIHIKVN